MTHNARHQREPDSQCLFASVPKVRGSLIVKSGGLSVEFDEGDGLKNRRLAANVLRRNRFHNSPHADCDDRMGTLLGTLRKSGVKSTATHWTDLCSRRNVCLGLCPR